MVTIESTLELEAVSGGAAQALKNIKCTVSSSPSCTGSFQDYLNVAFGAFDQLQSWGGQFGNWLYDATHGGGKK